MTAVPYILNKSRRRDVALVALLGVIQTLAMGLAIFATRDAFAALHDGNVPTIGAIALLMFAGCAVAGIQLTSRIRAEAIGQSFAKSLRRRIYSHIAGMGDTELSRRRIGALSLRFVGDLSAARGWAGLGIARLASAAVVLPGAVIALYLLNPVLAIAGMLPVSLSLVFSIGLAIGLAHRHRDLRSRRARVAISMMERINIASALDLSGRTRRELKALDEGSEQLKDNAVRRMGRLELLRALPHVGAAVGGAAVLWAAGTYNLSAADAAATLAMLTVLVLPLGELTGVWDRYCAWRIAKEKCLRLMSFDSERRHIEPRAAPVPVVFRNVSFRGIDMALSIAAGSCVRVSGPAGSGKSSILSLIAGRDRPDSGQVTYGDQSGLPKIVYVGDTPMIMQGSLRRNATLGVLRRPPDATIVEMLTEFGLEPLLDRLGGLGGRVHEHGRSLSGGEVVRIELARAALSQPDLIVIDCAKLSADPMFEELISRLRANSRATIVFSHAHNCQRTKGGTPPLGGRVRFHPQVALADLNSMRPLSSDLPLGSEGTSP